MANGIVLCGLNTRTLHTSRKLCNNVNCISRVLAYAKINRNEVSTKELQLCMLPKSKMVLLELKLSPLGKGVLYQFPDICQFCKLAEISVTTSVVATLSKLAGKHCLDLENAVLLHGRDRYLANQLPLYFFVWIKYTVCLI
jgi:hypothetical protein